MLEMQGCVVSKGTEWIFNGVLAGTAEEFEYTRDCVCGNEYLYGRLAEAYKEIATCRIDAAIAAMDMPDYGDDTAIVLLDLGFARVTLKKGRGLHSTSVRLLKDTELDTLEWAA